MSTPSLTDAPTPSSASPPRPVYKVTGRRVAQSEWHKLRSMWITLGLSTLFLVGFGVIVALQYKSSYDAGKPLDGPSEGATRLSLPLFGANSAQLPLGVLAPRASTRPA